MSRNRASSSCECGFWNFKNTPVDNLSINDPSLRTWEQYRDDIDWKDTYAPYYLTEQYRSQGPYQTRLEGESYWWRSPDGTGGASFPRDGYRKILFNLRASVSENERYRFCKIECSICRRLYVGHYVQQPYTIGGEMLTSNILEPRCYELHDTSFYYAYNDKPSDRDVVNLIHWTGDLLAKAAMEYAERHFDLKGELYAGSKDPTPLASSSVAFTKGTSR